MDENTIGERVKRARNCQCPTCEAWFTSRKARHTHQMQSHRRPKTKPDGSGRRLRPAAELYR